MNDDITEEDEVDAALWVARHLGGPVDVMAFAQWMGDKPGRRELFDAMWVNCADQSVTTALEEYSAAQGVAPVAANDTEPERRAFRGLLALGAAACWRWVPRRRRWRWLSGPLSGCREARRRRMAKSTELLPVKYAKWRWRMAAVCCSTGRARSRCSSMAMFAM
ncbi:hypothetical protein [Aurantiacibacter xanthus]|uniref:hypothetical protein n=1 Tax=Aurantiacibacter xanthus TaxID=1784712 RepID=UPI00174E63EE|nr:hypothetical protein [Aurantiacibacter xanthus]